MVKSDLHNEMEIKRHHPDSCWVLKSAMNDPGAQSPFSDATTSVLVQNIS